MQYSDRQRYQPCIYATKPFLLALHTDIYKNIINKKQQQEKNLAL